MTRQFTAQKAVRTATPLLIGLVGPSGSGKTKSALRLATGIRSVVGDGPIIVIDTEANRSKHYAEDHEFLHIPFDPPFGSLDYLEVLQYAASLNPSVIIVDSMSHEHEGAGGYIEFHDSEVKRLLNCGFKNEQAAGIPAWAGPSKNRRKLINGILQMKVPAFIFCFRAKEKLKIIRGKDPEPLGWMSIGGDEFVYEMTVCALLTPGCKGVPDWNPDGQGSKSIIKEPGQFHGLLGAQLDEEMGARMAEWSAGVAPAITPMTDDQLEYINQLITEGGVDKSALLRRYKVDSLEAMPADWYQHVVDALKARIGGVKA
jgi:hypothetical protein